MSCEVGADVVEVDCGRGVLAGRFDFARLDEDERVALEDGIAGRDGEPAHEPAERRRDDVLHLHRFHDEQLLAFADEVAFGHVDLDDRALEGRDDGGRAFGAMCGRCCHWRRRRGWCGGRRARAGLPVVEHGQRIAGVDLHASEARTTGRGRRSCGRGHGHGETFGPIRGGSGKLGDVVLDELWCLCRLTSTTGCARIASRNAVFVTAPSMRNSPRARAARFAASAKRGDGE